MFLPLQHITLNIQKLSCSASCESTSQKQFFALTLGYSHTQKMKSVTHFSHLKLHYLCMDIMASESEYSPTPTEKFTFSKVVSYFIKKGMRKGTQSINLYISEF